MAAEASIARRAQRRGDDDLYVEASDPLAVTAHICQGFLAGDIASIRSNLQFWQKIRVTDEMAKTVETTVEKLAEDAKRLRAERLAERSLPGHRVIGEI